MEQFLEPIQSGVYTLGILDRVDGEDVFIATNGDELIHIDAVALANTVSKSVGQLLDSHAQVRIKMSLVPAPWGGKMLAVTSVNLI